VATLNFVFLISQQPNKKVSEKSWKYLVLFALWLYFQKSESVISDHSYSMFTNTPTSPQRKQPSNNELENQEEGDKQENNLSDEDPDYEGDGEERSKQSTSKKKVLKVKRANNKSNKVSKVTFLLYKFNSQYS